MHRSNEKSNNKNNNNSSNPQVFGLRPQTIMPQLFKILSIMSKILNSQNNEVIFFSTKIPFITLNKLNFYVIIYQVLHWAVVTPIFFPVSTVTNPRGKLTGTLMTSSILPSSKEYVATTSRTEVRTLVTMFSQFLLEPIL